MININIESSDQNQVNSLQLEQIANLIEDDYGIPVERKKLPAKQGDKDGGLVIALTLTLSAIGTLISVLSYWQSTRTKASFTLKRGDVTVTVENVSPAKIQELVAQFENPKLPEIIDIEIVTEED